MAMKFIRFTFGVIVLASLLVGQVNAARVLRGTAGSGISQYAKGVINLGSNELVPSNTVNIFKSCALSYPTIADIVKLDATGYLTSAPTSNVSFSCNNTGFYSGVHYRIKWASGTTQPIVLNSCSGGFTLVSGTATTSGCTGFSGSITPTTGQAGEVDTIVNSPSFFFPNSGTYAHTSGELAMFRASDETLYNSGQYWTQDFINEVKITSPLICRMMGMIIIGGAYNGEVKWNYRMTTSQFTWATPLVPPTIVAGGGSAAITWSTGDAYTASAATDTPGSVTANEQFIGIFSQANAGTSPTLNIAGRGSKPIYNALADVPAVGEIEANTAYAMFYDAVLGGYILSEYSNPELIYSGIQASVPYEALIQLTNSIGCSPWINIPAMVDDTYATNAGSLVQSNLKAGLSAYFEYGNEIWNFGFPSTFWAAARGAAFGFPNPANSEAVFGYYGIRIRQVLANDIPNIWSGGATASNYQPIMAYQAGGDTTNQAYRFEGSQVCPIAAGGSCAGNAAYNSFTGSANWSVAGSRPIDATKAIAMAPYAGGANLCTGPDLNCTPTAANAPFYQALINAWETGNTTLTRSLIDNDIRNGLIGTQTVTAIGTTFTVTSTPAFIVGSDVVFTISGGTSYSGIPIYSGSNASAVYHVTGLTGLTFTIQPYSGGFPSGANVNAGTVGTGTLSVGYAPTQTMLKLTSNWDMFSQANAARYNGGAGGSRPAGMGNLIGRQYEGGIEPQGLSDSQCSAIGVTSSQDCATDIVNALNDWRESALSAQTEWDYMKQFMGTYAGTSNFGLMTFSGSPANLILNDGAPWYLVAGYTPNFAPWQLYYGWQSFNTNP